MSLLVGHVGLSWVGLGWIGCDVFLIELGSHRSYYVRYVGVIQFV